MNAESFIAKTRSNFSDNAGRRTLGRQASGSGIDGARLGLLGVGDFRVFTKPGDRLFKAWHVEMMVDCSGSITRDNRDVILSECVVRLHKALRQAQVGKVCATGYNRDEIGIEADIAKGAAALKRKLNSFYEMFNPDTRGGGSHDGYMIRRATQRLMNGNAPGKMLLVLTDGRPNCDYAKCDLPGCFGGYKGREGLRTDLIAALGEARKQGVIALGVGVQAEHVTEFYGKQHSVSVNDLQTLFSDAARLLERHIIRG